MGNSAKHPIIGNGQYYIEPIIKKNFGGGENRYFLMNIWKQRLGLVLI